MDLEQNLKQENNIKYEKKGFLKPLFLTAAVLSLPFDLKTETPKNYQPEANKYEVIANEQEHGNDAYSYSELEKITTPKWTMQGRVERAKRFDNLFKKYESKYDMPEGLLAGLAMQESYGEPLKLNSSGDGGAGLMQMQPGTAIWLGLEIYGNGVNTGVDLVNGRELKEMVRRNNNDLDLIMKKDERFDPEKSIEAAAKFLNWQYERFGDWHSALSAYNRGIPAANPLSTVHVNRTLESKHAYNNNSYHLLAENK